MELSEIREFFKSDTYAVETTGIEIADARKNYARCTLAVDDRHRNALGGLMGGVCFTMADFAAAIAGNVDSPPTVAITASINFVNGLKGSVLTAEANCVKAGRGSTVFRVDITDDLDTLIATAMVTGYRKG